MFNILLFIGCLAKHKIEYIPIGGVDRYDNGVCGIERQESRYSEYTTIYMKSKNCKDGDIIAIARQKY